MDEKTSTLKGIELLTAYADGYDDSEFLKEHLLSTLGDTDNVEQTLMLAFSGVLSVAGRLLELLSDATGRSVPEILHSLSARVQREG